MTLRVRRVRRSGLTFYSGHARAARRLGGAERAGAARRSRAALAALGTAAGGRAHPRRHRHRGRRALLGPGPRHRHPVRYSSGALINLLDASIPDAFRRSVKVVFPHFVLVFCLVTLPLAIEHEVLVLVADLIPHEMVFLVFLSTFVRGGPLRHGPRPDGGDARRAPRAGGARAGGGFTLGGRRAARREGVNPRAGGRLWS